MENKQIVSFCGDLCSECPRFMATQASDMAKLKELAELWFRLGFRTDIVGVEEIKCTGCSKAKPCSYEINNCIYIHDLNNCGECKLYPCAKINLVFEKTDKVDEICKAKCSTEEYAQMKKAFLMKREVLNEKANVPKQKCGDWDEEKN